MIHVYYGEGKGKTTAAAGLALRAAGNGLRVLFVQFMKARSSGETAMLSALPGVTVLKNQTELGFYKRMTVEQKEQAYEMHRQSLERAAELIEGEGCGLLVLDEVFSAYGYGLLDREAVLSLLSRAEEGQFELVLTGREPDAVFIERADYITQMKKERHPFDKGVSARKGIEY